MVARTAAQWLCILALAGAAPGATNAQGLVGWWKCEGNGINAMGGEAGAVGPETGFVLGAAGRGMYLQGAPASGITVADAPRFQLTRSLSIEAVVQVNALPKDAPGAEILFRGDDRTGLDPYSLVLLPTGEIAFTIASQTEGRDVRAEIPMGRLVHVLGTLDDRTGAMSLYVVGKLAAWRVTHVRPFGPLDPDAHPALGIGNHPQTPGTPHHFPFTGIIDEVKLYNVAVAPSRYDAAGRPVDG